MKLKYKLWLEQDGKVFGDGPLDILKRVEEDRIFEECCRRDQHVLFPGMESFKSLEKRLGFKLLKRRVGGASGGSSELTQEAKRPYG